MISRIFFVIIILFGAFSDIGARDSIYVLDITMFKNNGHLSLPDMTQWHFKSGNDSSWSNKNLDLSDWTLLDSTELTTLSYDDSNIFECWWRIKIRLDSSFHLVPLYLLNSNTAAQKLYVDGLLYESFGNMGIDGQKFKSHESRQQMPKPLRLNINQTYDLSIHFKDNIGTLSSNQNLRIIGQNSILEFLTHEAMVRFSNQKFVQAVRIVFILSVFGVLIVLTWMLALLNRKEGHLTFIALLVTLIFLSIGSGNFADLVNNSNEQKALFQGLSVVSGSFALILLPMVSAKIFIDKIPHWLKIYGLISSIIMVYSIYIFVFSFGFILLAFASIYILYLIIFSWKNLKGPKWFVVGGIGLTLLLISIVLLGNYFGYSIEGDIIPIAVILTFPLSLLLYMTFWLRESIHKERGKSKQLLLLTEEKQAILMGQNDFLEREVNSRTAELKTSLKNLKSTQAQLIQSEKMASLGELTAGIAHEIQNPLNFINNFSDVNIELTDELVEEINSGEIDQAKAIIKDIRLNEEKINHHGKRADAIVKGMLQHSRTSTGQKELTDINALADEYLRLAYHGLRAKDSAFNADFMAEFDPDLPKVNVIPQDIGRVLLNLINNAFQAVHVKSKNNEEGYAPKVTVSTHQRDSNVEITVSDNGPGIPDSIKDKIFQPFFTTKPTGQGTGLGLSLSYDIVKAHGGELTFESHPNNGTDFIIKLPLQD